MQKGCNAKRVRNMLPLGIEPRITAHKTDVITISLWELAVNCWYSFTYNTCYYSLNAFSNKYIISNIF